MNTKRKSAHQTVTEGRRRAFLEHLALHGCWQWAAAAASPSATPRGAGATFRDLARRDAEFARQCDEARATADARLEMEAWRRGVEGIERRVYQKGGQAVNADGTPAVEVVYSDRVLELLLKARLPAFQERSRIEVNGAIDHRHLGVLLTPADLATLEAGQRGHLRSILTTIARARGEDVNLKALPAPDDADGGAVLPALPAMSGEPELAHLPESDRAAWQKMCS